MEESQRLDPAIALVPPILTMGDALGLEPAFDIPTRVTMDDPVQGPLEDTILLGANLSKERVRVKLPLAILEATVDRSEAQVLTKAVDLLFRVDSEIHQLASTPVSRRSLGEESQPPKPLPITVNEVPPVVARLVRTELLKELSEKVND